MEKNTTFTLTYLYFATSCLRYIDQVILLTNITGALRQMIDNSAGSPIDAV